MMDGTDLAERGLDNFCSAVTIFDPTAMSGQRILAAFVCLPSGVVYYAGRETDTAYVHVRNRPVRKVSGPSSVTEIRNASICFYGQKAGKLQKLVSTGSLLAEMAKLEAQQKTGLRIYTLAGIPMMVRLADHVAKDARGIDAVFEISGQKPHDVVAGVYIAKKSGACLKDLSGNELDYVQLEEALLKPSMSSLRYVLASTEELCDEIITLLKKQ